MVTVNIHEAKTQLSKLVDQAAKGEAFVIAKAGKPLVKVAALDAPAAPRAAGLPGGRDRRARRFRPHGRSRDRGPVRERRVKLLLDTQLLLWAAGQPERLSAAARKLLNNPRNELLFSAASLWEIAIKNTPGTGGLPRRAAPAAPGSARQRLHRASRHEPARGEHRQPAALAQGSLRPAAAGPGPQRGDHPRDRRCAAGPLPRTRAQGVGRAPQADREVADPGLFHQLRVNVADA